jgi:hypothetical protein
MEIEVGCFLVGYQHYYLFFLMGSIQIQNNIKPEGCSLIGKSLLAVFFCRCHK